MKQPEEQQRSRQAQAGDLKELLIEVGLQIVDDQGLRLGPETISYAKVFSYLEEQYSVKVTRASVHERIWPSHDHFRREVLAEAVKHVPNRTADPLQALRGADATDPTAGAISSDLERRSGFPRRMGASALEEMVSSPALLQLQSVKGIASRFESNEDADDLREELRLRAGETLEQRRRRFSALMSFMGFKPAGHLGLSAELSSDIFHIAVRMMFSGIHLYYHSGFQDVAEPLVFLPEGEVEYGVPWVLPSIGLKAIAEYLYEHQPSGGLELERVPETLQQRAGPEVVAGPGTTGSDRRPRAELKRLVLAAGVELLLRDGLELKSEALGYAAVFARVKETTGRVVHRSSVHNRFWASQEEFQVAVLTRAVEEDPSTDPAVTELFERAPKIAAGGGPRLLGQSVADLIRYATDGQCDALVESPAYRRRLLVKAALLGSDPEGPMRPLREAVRETDRKRIDQQKGVMRAMVMNAGFEVRPELGIGEPEALEILGLLLVVTLTGAIFDRQAGVGAVVDAIALPRFDDPSVTDTWTPTSVAAYAFFTLLYRPMES